MPRPQGHALNRAAWDDVLALKGLTLSKVADMSGTPRPTLSALRGGFNRASVPVVHQIAAALDVQPATLFPTIVARFEEQAS